MLTDNQIRVLVRRIRDTVTCKTRIIRQEYDGIPWLVFIEPMKIRSLGMDIGYTPSAMELRHPTRYACWSRGAKDWGWMITFLYIPARDEIYVSQAKRLDCGWHTQAELKAIEFLNVVTNMSVVKFGRLPGWHILKAQAILE